MTKHKSETGDALDKLRRKRGAALKAVAKYCAALDTCLKDSPDLLVKFDEEDADEYGLVEAIERPKPNGPPRKRLPS
jgi:hypothetical protein